MNVRARKHAKTYDDVRGRLALAALAAALRAGGSDLAVVVLEGI
eukprot:CAMPEP_0115627056 /NCGR_PEP_ID=MMETSP0272-20121206/28668_1 /TAXON_ID=71861 /ORGANISM="Scrippsiella trochoidea, Strain CCMP3099" /LENGTH=43 /DNA_ID= /DNA_START= /DNA_END= /DNA_ORIENTATION=